MTSAYEHPPHRTEPLGRRLSMKLLNSFAFASILGSSVLSLVACGGSSSNPAGGVDSGVTPDDSGASTHPVDGSTNNPGSDAASGDAAPGCTQTLGLRERAKSCAARGRAGASCASRRAPPARGSRPSARTARRARRPPRARCAAAPSRSRPSRRRRPARPARARAARTSSARRTPSAAAERPASRSCTRASRFNDLGRCQKRR